MSKLAYERFEDDLRISPRPILAIVLAGALLASIWPEITGDPERTLNFTALLFGALALVWLLDVWRPRIGRWFTIILLVVVIEVADAWFEVPGLLGLLAIPTALAAALISMPAALATAFGGSLLLIGLQHLRPGANWTSPVVGLAAIWGILGVVYAIYQSVWHLARWARQESQELQGVLGEARDRRAELHQSIDNLAYANRQLALANERISALREMAEGAERAKAAFVAKVSHEFRTPLNMIIGLVELMVETPEIYSVVLSPEVWEDLRVVHRNCEHLANLVNDVLDLSQLEAGRLALHRERVDLRDIIENCVAVVRPLLDKKHLALEIKVPDDLPEPYCDRVRIQQVLLNLVSNAARYTNVGGITVEAALEDDHVVVRLADTGVGIGPEDAKRVFEPFYQAAGGRLQDSRGGSGLGLSISRQFVELHGGRMWFHSESGCGSSFCFSLPVSPPMRLTGRPGHQIREDWVWRESAFKGARDAAVSKLLKRRVVVCDPTGVLCPQFARYCDEVEFVATSSLAQAIQDALQCTAHAVIVNTAGADDPWSLVETARQEMPDTPIMACCVAPQAQRAATAGALGQLIKPVTRAGLQEAIRAVGKPVKRVLLVDDDADVRHLFSRMLLLCDSSLDLVFAATGAEALHELRVNPPDLMLLDLVMPDMDGWEVLRAMEDDERSAAVPTYLVSAQDPEGQPPASRFFAATIGDGLPLNKLLHSCLEMSSLLLRPETEPDPVPE